MHGVAGRSKPSEAAPRVLHLAQYHGVAAGAGLYVAARSTVQSERAVGIRASLWTLAHPRFSDGEAGPQAPGTGETVFGIRGPAHMGISPALEAAAAGPFASRFDVLQQHGLWLVTSRATRAGRRTWRRPVIVAPHGSLSEYCLQISPLKKRLALHFYEGDNLRLADCLHATSISEVEEIRRFGLRNPVALIPNPLPRDGNAEAPDGGRFRERFGLGEESRIMLFLSRIHPKKGLPMLLEALDLVRTSLGGWVLCVVGMDERGHEAVVRSRARELALTDRVLFCGPLFDRDKWDAFDAADLFVLPTHSENSGLVVLEALQSHVPVITTTGAPWAGVEDAVVVGGPRCRRRVLPWRCRRRSAWIGPDFKPWGHEELLG